MAALDQNALLLEYGNIYIGDDENSAVDIGALRNVKFVGAQTSVDIRSDNRGSLIRKNRLNGTITFDWLEPGDMVKLNELLKGIVELESVAGALVAGALQEITAPFIAQKFYKITNQNGNGAAVVVNSVTGSVDGVLVANDDYIVTQDEQGNYGIVLNTVAGGSTLTTLNQDITIDYDYTPSAMKKIIGGTSKVATPRFVKIVGPSAEDPNLSRTVILTAAVVDGDIEFPFLDTEEANDVGVMPVTMINEKNAEWRLEDEINPN